MKLVVGLGNPGSEYVTTRHNVGFMVVDELQKLKLPASVVIKKSDTFMNESGVFVKKILDKYKLSPECLYIIHDDLDIKLGEFKIQLGHGPRDHNGIKSVDDQLGTDQYWHVRIGIDNRPLDNKTMGIEYVLQNFTEEEKEIVNKVVKEAARKLIFNLNG